MDYDKLIEQLNARGLSNGSSQGYHCGLYDEAATALSTLQAENEKLRGELESVRAERNAAVVHGKWKIMHVGRTIKCSNCGRIFDRFVNGAQLPERCFCGAKMDGGEKANE